jgi:hypothetical protein
VLVLSQPDILIAIKITHEPAARRGRRVDRRLDRPAGKRGGILGDLPRLSGRDGYL